MIVVSGVLVLVALVFLVIGLIGEGLAMIWASIITSLVAGVFLLLGALQRRGQPAAATEGASTAAAPMEHVTAVNVRSREDAAPAVADDVPADTAAASADASPEVSVVPGRPRYHVASCRFLTGRPDVQNVPLDEARTDGYTACGVCKPDAALAQAETALATAPETTDAGSDEAIEQTAAFEAADVSAATTDDTAADAAAAPTRARKAPAKRAAAAKPARATATAEVAEVTDASADAPAAPAKAARPAKKAGAAGAAAGGAATGTNQVVVIPDRGKFHTEMCRFVKDVPGTVNLSKPAAKRQGYTPCGVCKP